MRVLPSLWCAFSPAPYGDSGKLDGDGVGVGVGGSMVVVWWYGGGMVVVTVELRLSLASMVVMIRRTTHVMVRMHLRRCINRREGGGVELTHSEKPRLDCYVAVLLTY